MVRFFLSLLTFILLSSGLSFANTQNPIEAQFEQVEVSKNYDYPTLFELANRILLHDSLYSYLNDVFKDQLLISEQDQKEYGWPAKSKGLSLSQMVFILQYADTLYPILNEYLIKVPSKIKENEASSEISKLPNNEDTKLIANELKEELLELKSELDASQNFSQMLAQMNKPNQPLVLLNEDGSPGYRGIRMFVNHPSLQDPSNPESELIPADNIQLELIKFILEAREEVLFNVFDFDLPRLKDAFIRVHKKHNVSVLGGIDHGVIDARPEVKKIWQDFQKHKVENKFNVIAVDSVGLNHMKIVVRDPNGPRAAIMVLSGNFTQSCIGFEGDLVHVPGQDRPKTSIPNANNAVIIHGKLPALVGKYELKKTLEAHLRGQSQYPISGSFKILGSQESNRTKNNWIQLAFSPNGGMGDVSRDILGQLILNTHGPMKFSYFALSSSAIEKAILQKISSKKLELNSLGLKLPSDFIMGVGENLFAMRDWSVFLRLSGYQQDLKTKKYSPDLQAPIRSILNETELQDLQSHLKVAPWIYRQSNFNYQGVQYTLNAKLHHKSMVFPEDKISVVGTSFNASEGAEANNEQILIVKDSSIAKRTDGMMMYLLNESNTSIVQRALDRNKIPGRDEEKDPDDPEDGVDREIRRIRIPRPLL